MGIIYLVAKPRLHLGLLVIRSDGSGGFAEANIFLNASSGVQFSFNTRVSGRPRRLFCSGWAFIGSRSWLEAGSLRARVLQHLIRLGCSYNLIGTFGILHFRVCFIDRKFVTQQFFYPFSPPVASRASGLRHSRFFRVQKRQLLSRSLPARTQQCRCPFCKRPAFF